MSPPITCITGFFVALVATQFPLPPASAQPVVVRLSTGETLSATLVSLDDDGVVLDHPVLGRLTVRHRDVDSLVVRETARIDSDRATSASDGAASAGTDLTTTAPDVHPSPPTAATETATVTHASPDAVDEKLPVAPDWVSRIELGLSGASGNTSNFNLRTAFNTSRDTREFLTKLDASYTLGVTNNDKSTDRAEVQGRNDWKMPGSPWRIFLTGTFEYDRFQDWNYRTSAIAGPGYELIRSDTVLLLLRAGAGLSREFAGADNRFNPELNFGGDYEYTITDYQRLVARADIFPSLLNFPSDYRIALNGAYEVRLNTAVPLLLKLGVENRYESEPTGGKRRNDLLYFLNIVHSF